MGYGLHDGLTWCPAAPYPRPKPATQGLRSGSPFVYQEGGESALNAQDSEHLGKLSEVHERSKTSARDKGEEKAAYATRSTAGIVKNVHGSGKAGQQKAG